MTRDPARIDLILADLRRYWHAAPDLRLGQMVMGLLNLSGAPRYGEFNAEDDKVAAYLAAWAAANPPPPDHRDAEIARLRAELATARANTERSAAAMADVALAARAKLDAMTPPTLPPEIEAAIADAGQALVDAWDSAEIGPPHRFAVFTDPEGDPEVAAGWMAMARMHAAAIAAAREAGRRDVLEGAAGVETSLLKLAAVAYSQGTHAVRARIGEDGADRDHLRASGDLIVAEQSHRAAIAADKAALDATWRAHDLERDAEVAQAQAATHEACAALQAICAALHVTPSTGSTYCAEAVAMVVERVAADKARAVEAATAEIRADLAKAHEAIGQAQVEIVRLSSPVEQFRDAPTSPEFTEDLRSAAEEAAAVARLAARGIDSGVEMARFTAEHYDRMASAECPFTPTDAASLREWMAQWPLSAEVLPTARITLVRLLRAVESAAADKARAVEAARETERASLSMRMAVICEIADEAIATASEAPDGWEQVADYRERLAKWRADRQADRAALTGAGGGR